MRYTIVLKNGHVLYIEMSQHELKAMFSSVKDVPVNLATFSDGSVLNLNEVAAIYPTNSQDNQKK